METKNKEKVVSLCDDCAEFYREAFEVSELAHGVGRRLVCEHCGRKKFGRSYKIKKK